MLASLGVRASPRGKAFRLTKGAADSGRAVTIWLSRLDGSDHWGEPPQRSAWRLAVYAPRRQLTDPDFFGDTRASQLPRIAYAARIS